MDLKKTRIDNFVLEVYVPCQDSALLEIFNEERCNMELEGHDIQLLVPENNDNGFDGWWNLARSNGSKESWYDITLFPNNIEDSTLSYRSLIRHEFAHIKHGDLDRHLPRVINWFYRQFIAEPRARRYE